MQTTHVATSMRTIHTAALALIFVATAVNAASEARYLALGDSVAFGFNPLIKYTQGTVRSGEFIGYPESIADAAGLNVTNASCPGETSGSFLDASQPDNGCHSGPNYGAHLKVDYDGAPNQMAFALNYLADHRDTEVITINLGGNDLLLLQQECRQSPDFFQCALSRLPGVLANAGADLATIFGTLRRAGFAGQIIVLTQYATNYNDPIAAYATSLLRDVTASVADPFEVDVAPGFEAFAFASAPVGYDACKAGLLITLPDGTCDFHPSDAGREVLTSAVLSVLR